MDFNFGIAVYLLAVSDIFCSAPATTTIYTLSLHDALPIYPNDLIPDPNMELLTLLQPSLSPFPSVTYLFIHLTVLRSEEHTFELQSPDHLVCCLLLEKTNHRFPCYDMVLIDIELYMSAPLK